MKDRVRRPGTPTLDADYSALRNKNIYAERPR